jgi:hypothetical protein
MDLAACTAKWGWKRSSACEQQPLEATVFAWQERRTSGKPCTDHGTRIVTEYGKRLADTDLFEAAVLRVGTSRAWRER